MHCEHFLKWVTQAEDQGQKTRRRAEEVEGRGDSQNRGDCLLLPELHLAPVSISHVLVHSSGSCCRSEAPKDKEICNVCNVQFDVVLIRESYLHCGIV